MELKHTGNTIKGMFYLEENGHILAELSYTFAGETKIIIDHTVVNPNNEGKGLGKQLVKAIAAFARENGYKILPICPYAKSVMEKSDEYKDVLF